MPFIKNINIKGTVYDIKSSYDGDGNNIKNTYATKTDLESKVDLEKYSLDKDTFALKAELKTINGESIIGSGNITVQGETTDLSNYYNKGEIDAKITPKLDTSIYIADKLTFALKTELGNKVDKDPGKSLIATSLITKLEGLKTQEDSDTAIANAKKAGTDAQTNLTSHIGTKTNPHGVTKAQVGLENVDNTSDANKPVSIATKAALDKKVNKVDGKQLSTEDYTTAEKTKLQGVSVNANNYIHPTTAGNKHIPAGGTAGQILVNNGDGTAKWQDNQGGGGGIDYTGLEDIYSYGVEWDSTVADPHLTRIGNPLLHKSLPVQSQYRGCVANGATVNYYLNPNDWSQKANGTPSVLDGTDGTVRVHIPRFYGKSGTEGTKRWVRISTIKMDDTWIEIPEMLVDAYRSTVNQTGNKAVSVVNTTAQFRGGSNRTANDTYLDTDAFRSDLGKPRTSLSRSIMRTYATNAGSELLCYEYYKWVFYWAWVIEYATFNSQATYNANLTSEGYHQGGLGDGITTMANWGEYNNYCPLTPCGYGNSIGNFTGIKDLVIPEFTYSKSSIRFDSWNNNATVCTSSNGSDNSKVITEVKITDNYAFYHNPDNVWGTTTYHISGLTEGQKVIFKEQQSGNSYTDAVIVKEVTQDGEVVINWGEYNKNGQKYVGFSMVQQGCNIKIYNSNINTTTVTRPIQTLKMPRWRGFDNPFGDIWTNLDGIILERTAANQPSSVYTTTDPTAFGDDNTAKDKMTIAGVEIASNGWIKDFDLRETGEIIPSVVGGGSTTYMCDYHYCNIPITVLRTLVVGGGAYTGGGAGLGYFDSNNGVDAALAIVGFRTLNKVV